MRLSHHRHRLVADFARIPESLRARPEFLRIPLPLLALLIFVCASAIQAAPPKLDYLFPAGTQRGTSVEVTLGGVFERWPVQAWSSAKGIDIKPGKVSGKLMINASADAEPGIAWIRLHDEQGPSTLRPFIIGTLLEVLEKEPNDDPKKPQVIDRSCVVNGRLEKIGDVDTFAVKLMKGQTLVASLEANRTLRSPMDGVLQLLSSEGFVLEQNDDYHGIDPQIVFAAPKDGAYLIRVFAFPAVPDSSIRFAGKENFVYRLTLTTGAFVEYAFPLAVPRSAPEAVELIGWNIPDEIRKFPVKPHDGDDVLKLFHPQMANPFTVRLEPHAAMTKTKATREHPQTITLPVTITGRLDRPGDVDVYQFKAKKGEKLSFRIEARTLGFRLDPVLRLTDDTGKMLTQARATALGTDPLLDYTATEEGTYRLEVSDLHSHGGLRHVYRLRAGPVPADFSLKVVGDSHVLTPGKPAEIPVTVERRGAFKQEVVLGVEGLPKDITATTTANGITLRLNSDKAAFSGPIRIVGTTKDGMLRPARAAVTELGQATEYLWLTVKK